MIQHIGCPGRTLAARIPNISKGNVARLLIAFLPCVLMLPASAIEDKHLSLEQQLRQAPGASLDDIARQIRRDNNWRILAAEPRILEEKTIYRFKLLNRKRGRVKVIEVIPSSPTN